MPAFGSVRAGAALSGATGIAGPHAYQRRLASAGLPATALNNTVLFG